MTSSHLTVKSNKVSLTREKRLETWQTLTSSQQATLMHHIHLQQTSAFVDANLSNHSHTWHFVGYHHDDFYDQSDHEHLFCDCGRRLKHQYILQNEDGTIIKLGITHFADHLGVNETIVRQLQQQLHHINFGLDEILQRIRRHAGLNPQMRSWFLNHHHQFHNLPKDAIAFINQGLPLSVDDQKLIVNSYKKATYIPKTSVRRPKNKKLEAKVWFELFRDI